VKIKEEIFNPAYKKEARSFTMFYIQTQSHRRIILKQVLLIVNPFRFKKEIITAL